MTPRSLPRPPILLRITVCVLTTVIGASAASGKALPDVGPMTWDTLAKRLDEEAARGFSGSVLIVRDGETVLDRGYGLANREKKIPNRPDTVYGVGSQPIDFTHLGILWLAQHGELDLQAPITDFFDRVPSDKRAITVEHLMTGASGLPDFHDRPGDRDPDHAWIDRDEAMRRIFEAELLFAPGTGDEHSHSAWGVLAAIIEIVSGESYQDFTKKHIYTPAGMVDTGFFGDPVPADRLAIGYGVRRDGEVNAPPFWGKTSWLVMGSGGQISTTRDTGRMLDAVREGKILAPAWADRFFGPGPGANRNGDVYGFEMFVFHAPKATSYAVLITNANKPARGSDGDTHFVRVARAVGDLILAPYRPKFSLGIEMAPGPDGTVAVDGVQPGSAAERAGLRTGDLLVTAGGVGFGGDPMAVLLPYLKSGDAIAFVVRRGGETLEIVVKPAPR